MIDPPRETIDALAPVSGKIVKLWPHAYAIQTPEGAGVLVHLGLDTVQLKGEGFSTYVEQGDEVEVGQPIVSYDVPAIEAARQPLIKAIQTELRGRGYQPMTPLDSRTALVAFGLKDARSKLGDLMKAANIRMTVSQNRFRVSLAVFNDMNDVDRLLSALPRTPPA